MLNDQYVYRPRRERNAGIKLIRLISFIIVVFVSIFFVFFAIQGRLTSSSLISPLAYPLTRSSIPFKDILDKKNQISEIVQNILKDKAGDYGVVVMNLKTGENYVHNEHKLFESASLYKLWVMAVTFEQISDGRLKKTDIMEQKIEVLNEKFKIATESAELKEGEIKLSVNDALRQMITISDNYSALLLTERLRLFSVSDYLSYQSFNESKVGLRGEAPVTSAYDMALFFEKLYKEETQEKNDAGEMLTLLKMQQLNRKLPKYLPKDIIVAHKTGELGEFSHDAGIIYTSKGDYIIVVLSKTRSIVDADEKIAQISKEVYNYFKNK